MNLRTSLNQMEVDQERICPSEAQERSKNIVFMFSGYRGDVEDTTATCMRGRPGSFGGSRFP